MSRLGRRLLLGAALLSAGCGGGAGEGDSPPASTSPAPVDRTAEEEAARSDPDYVRRQQRFANAYNSGNYLVALEEAKAALEAVPVLEEPYIWVSRLCTELGRNEDCIRFFGRVVELHPELPWPWFYRGFNEYHLNRLDEALVSFRRASELDPSDARAFFRQAMILQTRGDFEEATATVRASFDLDPTNPTTAARYVDLLKITGDYTTAERVALEALELRPDAAELHSALGALRQRKGELDSAESSFRRAIELDPELREAHQMLGQTLLRTGRDAEARRAMGVADRINDYENAHKTLMGRIADSRDAIVPLLLAELELTAGKLDQAQRWFSRADQMGGPPVRVAAGLAETLFRKGDVATGDRWIARLQGKDDGRVGLAQAARAVAVGDHAGAAASIESAIESGPAEREFLRRAADLYAALGRAADSDRLLDLANDARELSYGFE